MVGTKYIKMQIIPKKVILSERERWEEEMEKRAEFERRMVVESRRFVKRGIKEGVGRKKKNVDDKRD